MRWADYILSSGGGGVLYSNSRHFTILNFISVMIIEEISINKSVHNVILYNFCHMCELCSLSKKSFKLQLFILKLPTKMVQLHFKLKLTITVIWRVKLKYVVFKKKTVYRELYWTNWTNFLKSRTTNMKKSFEIGLLHKTSKNTIDKKLIIYKNH